MYVWFIGTFGQRTLWDLEKAAKERRRLPPDIYRIASAETLRSLHSSPGPRWRYKKARLAMADGKKKRKKKGAKKGKESKVGFLIQN